MGASSCPSMVATKSRAWAGGVGGVEGVPDVGVVGVLGGEAQVVRHGAAEEVCLLGYQPDAGPQLLERAIPDVDAIDQHRARGGVEEARDEIQKGRLAGAG